MPEVEGRGRCLVMGPSYKVEMELSRKWREESLLGIGTMTQTGVMEAGEGLVKTDKLSAIVLHSIALSFSLAA